MRQPNKEEYARDDRAEGESDTHPFLGFGRHRDETGVWLLKNFASLPGSPILDAPTAVVGPLSFDCILSPLLLEVLHRPEDSPLAARSRHCRAGKKAPLVAAAKSAAIIWQIRQPHDHPARTSRCDAPGSGRVTVAGITHASRHAYRRLPMTQTPNP